MRKLAQRISPEFSALLAKADYRQYLIALTVMRLGTGLRIIGVAWLVLALTNTTMSVALVLIIEALPNLLFGPFFGVFMDRMHKRRLAAWLNLLQVAASVSVIVLYLAGVLTVTHLFIASFFFAMSEVFFRTLRMGLVREFVSEAELLPANSLAAIVDQVGLMIGFGVAGLLIAELSQIAPFMVQASFFTIAALTFVLLAKGYTPDTAPAKGRGGWAGRLDELKDGMAYVGRNQKVIPTYILFLILVTTLQTLNVLLPQYARDVLAVGASGFGYIEAAFAIGAITGGLMLPTFKRRWPEERLVTYGIIGLSGAMFGFSLAFDLVSAIGIFLFVGFTYQVWIVTMTMAQQQVDAAYQGRVHTLFAFILSLVSIALYTGIGVLSAYISQRWILASQAMFLLLGLASVGLLTRHFRRRALTRSRPSLDTSAPSN